METAETKWYQRTELLIGSERVKKLNDSSVLVMGLGGVGAYAAELICRSGVGRMTIVDGDEITSDNRNRQLPALESTLGRPKAEIMANRLKDINPSIELRTIDKFITEKAVDELLAKSPDYVVDAIDSIAPKVNLIYQCFKKKIPIVSSMGAGGKFDPSQIVIADISKSYNCTLARTVRKRLHDLGIYKGIPVVFSPEKIVKSSVMAVNQQNKKSTVGTISYMPPAFGCFCASKVIRDLSGEGLNT